MMSCANDNTQTSHSDLQEYSYHLQEASYHLEQAEKALKEIQWHMNLYKGHVAECNKNSA